MKSKYINRELSWLSFNERVLQEAADENVPLVERLRFLGIFSNNRDEFFRVRVASVSRMVDAEKAAKKELGGILPSILLDEIHNVVLKQQKRFETLYRNLLNELQNEQIFIINETQLNPKQQDFVTDYFRENVRSLLIPIMLSKNTGTLLLRDKSIYFAVKCTPNNADEKSQYAVIEIPSRLPRFVELPSIRNSKYLMLVDDIIRFNLKEVFKIFDYKKIDAYTIKLTRDAELDIDNDISKSLIEKISKSLDNRKKGHPVRLIYDNAIPEDLLNFVKKKLAIKKKDALIPGGRYHNFKDFMRFPNVGDKHLEYIPSKALSHHSLDTRKSILDALMQKDVLLHYPFHSFDYFVEMLREAAIDPKVTVIRITLYRVAKNSKVINALINAAQNGKKVVAIVELQARFDEEANIYWARRMQEEGIQVVYGVPGLKVHSKLCLISKYVNKVRTRYAVVSTGNFNEVTSDLYTDFALYTADERITYEAKKVFDIFENNFNIYPFKHLIVSPHFSRARFLALIENEINNAKNGKKASLFLKMNSLVDKKMIKALYAASNAGVKVRLIVRGINVAVNGEEWSENIEAISIVGQFLEHSRVYIFENGGDELTFISSADWMPRNLDARIEVSCPIYDETIKAEIKASMEIYWKDNVKSRVFDAKQNNHYRETKAKTKVSSQKAIYSYIKAAQKKANESS